MNTRDHRSSQKGGGPSDATQLQLRHCHAWNLARFRTNMWLEVETKSSMDKQNQQ